MKKLLPFIGAAVLGIIFLGTQVHALSVSQTVQGGTGTSSPSGILYGDNNVTSHLNTVTIGAGCTFSGGTLSCPGSGSSFGKSWEISSGLFSANILAPTTTIPIYVSAQGTSTIANLGSVLDASAFPGVDIGAKLNAAYAALPPKGGQIMVPAGLWPFTTPIVFNTNGKLVQLMCPSGGGFYNGNGTVLNYTSVAPSTALTINWNNYVVGGVGITNCNFVGPAGSGNVSTSTVGNVKGIYVGGTGTSQGAFGMTMTGVHISGFGTGLYIGEGVSFFTFDKGVINKNARNIDSPNVSGANGENLRVTNSVIADCNSPTGSTAENCVVLSLTYPNVEWQFIGNSFDDAQVVLNWTGGVSNLAHFTNNHFENPDPAATCYSFIKMKSGETADNVIVSTGNDYQQDRDNCSEAILNGGTVISHGDTVDMTTGKLGLTRFITNQDAANVASWSGLTNLYDHGATTSAMYYVVATTPYSPQGYVVGANAPLFNLSAGGLLAGFGTSTPGTILSIGNTGGINFNPVATSTFGSSANGININNGCYAVLGVCITGSGGSGTVGSGTTGQFPYYAGAGTTLTATSSLFINTNQSVSIGTTTSGAGFGLTVVGANSSSGANVLKLVNIGTSGSGGGGGIQTFTSFVPTAQGDRLGFSTFGYTPGFTAETNRNAAGIFGYANQAWTVGSAQGAYMTFETTPDGSATRAVAMTVTGAGFVGIGTTSPQTQFDSQINSNASVALGQFKNYSSGAAAIAQLQVTNDIGAQVALLNYSSGSTITQNSYGGAFSLASMGRVRSSSTSNGLVVGAGGAKPLIFITNDNEAMRIQSGTIAGALIGIGTSSPYAKLSIHANPAETNTALFVIASSTGTATTTHFIVKNDGTIYGPNTGTGGGVQIGTWCYDANGQFFRDTAVCAVSDPRAKNIEGSFTTALDEIAQLDPIIFKYKPEFNGATFQNNPNYNGDQLGFSAKALQAIDPKLVEVYTFDGSNDVFSYKKGEASTVRPTALAALALAGVKELSERGVKVARSAEEDWQWGVIVLLALGLLAQQIQIRRLRK